MLKSWKSRAAMFAVAATIAVPVLGVASPASAQANQVSIGGTAVLGNNGLTVSETLTVTCDPSLNIAFGSVSVAQVSGHKVAQGSGFFENDFPGVPCTGSAQVVNLTVLTSTSFAFKNGSGLAIADVSLFDPVSGNLTDVSAGPPVEVRITK